jgi:hypothetical protein
LVSILVAGQLEEDVTDGFLNGGAVLNALQRERIVGEDGWHVSDRVVEAGVMVPHGVEPQRLPSLSTQHWCGLDGSWRNSGQKFMGTPLYIQVIC